MDTNKHTSRHTNTQGYKSHMDRNEHTGIIVNMDIYIFIWIQVETHWNTLRGAEEIMKRKIETFRMSCDKLSLGCRVQFCTLQYTCTVCYCTVHYNTVQYISALYITENGNYFILDCWASDKSTSYIFSDCIVSADSFYCMYCTLLCYSVL